MIEVNHITGVNTFNLPQGTEEWRNHRNGVITASRAHDIIKKGRGKGYSEARKTYMLELVSQVITGNVPESSNFKQAEWGHLNEPLARDAYEAIDFDIVTEAGLIYKDDSLRCAISPDGLLMDKKKGLEIKNPFTTKVHVDTVINREIKPEYLTQCQYSMWVTGWDFWDFCSYDHRIKGKSENRLCVIPQERDNEIMELFDVEIPKFIKEMDEILAEFGIEFGSQWK